MGMSGVFWSVYAGSKKRAKQLTYIQRQYLLKKFQTDKHQKEEAERALRSLIARGYVRMHPTRGEMTYELTDDGLAFCREMARRPA
jgi:hypothetical protein